MSDPLSILGRKLMSGVVPTTSMTAIEGAMTRRVVLAMVITLLGWAMALSAGWLVGRTGSVVATDAVGQVTRDPGPSSTENWLAFSAACAVLVVAAALAPREVRGPWIGYVVCGGLGWYLAGVGLPPFAPWVEWGPKHGGDLAVISLLIAVVGLAPAAVAIFQLLKQARVTLRLSGRSGETG